MENVGCAEASCGVWQQVTLRQNIQPIANRSKEKHLGNTAKRKSAGRPAKH